MSRYYTYGNSSVQFDTINFVPDAFRTTYVPTTVDSILTRSCSDFSVFSHRRTTGAGECRGAGRCFRKLSVRRRFSDIRSSLQYTNDYDRLRRAVKPRPAEYPNEYYRAERFSPTSRLPSIWRETTSAGRRSPVSIRLAAEQLVRVR